MDTKTLETLVKVSAHIVEKFVIGKPSVGSLISILLSDGFEIKQIIDHLHDIPKEAIDLNSEEAQSLSSAFTMELQDVADKTKIDEIFGRLLFVIPAIGGLGPAFRGKSPRAILESVFSLASDLIGVYEAFGQ